MFEQEIEKMISEMTIQEKAYALVPLENQYCCIPSKGFYGPTPQDVPGGGADSWRTYRSDVDNSGCPLDGRYHPVAFPVNSAVAMSWDKEFAYRIGQVFAIEAKANPDKVNILNRPGMNLKRSPLCGRNYDYFSEDPILTGMLAAQYVKGLQSENIGACPKHFIANNQEFERMSTNALISERVFYEVYLKPWKLVVQEGKPWMIMSSYNKLNGDWINSNKKCMEILRKEIGFEGVIVSDFMAIHRNKVEAHNNSMDIELATQENHTPELLEAIQEGKVSEQVIDASLRRQLLMALYAMSLENTAEADMKELHKEAIEAAVQCITLLKNDKILPVVKAVEGKEKNFDDINKLVIAGALAETPNIAGGGSGYMNGYIVEKPLKNIEKLAIEHHMGMKYCAGYRLKEEVPPVDSYADKDLLSELIREVKKGDLVIAFVGAPYGYESEGYDRRDLELPWNQRAMLDVLVECTDRVIIVLTGGSVYNLAPWTDRVKGILFAGMSGEGYGTAIADILFGRANPGGRLAETFPLDLCHEPSYFDFAKEGSEMTEVNYSEGLLVGYRWFDTRHLPVLFPFGYGLSYTTFGYTNFKIDKEVFTANEEALLSMDITNTGTCAGSQVIQLYIHEKAGLFKRPEKELKDFAKVYLLPGETKTVTFQVGRKELEIYNDILHKWGVQEDTYELLLNISAEENIWKTEIKITKGDKMFLFTEETSLIWFLKAPAFHRYLKENCDISLQNFFKLGMTDALIFMLSLPFCRLSESLQRNAFFTAEQVKEIVEYCNQFE